MLHRLLATAIVLAVGSAHAQSPAATHWPTRAVRIVVPFAAGSFTDIAARALGKELAQQTGQLFVVDNRTGAGGTIANDQVAKATDDHTLLFTDGSFSVSSALYKKLPYLPARDLLALAQVGESPAVLVARTGLPAKDLKAVVALARQDPSALSFGSGGQGSSGHLAMAEWLQQAGVEMVHVPYKGVAAAMVDVMGQRIDISIGSFGSTQALVKDGRVHALALSGAKRHPLMPQVPTFAEAGFPNYKVTYWFGLMAPASMPAHMRDAALSHVRQAIGAQGLGEIFERSGVALAYVDTASFTQRIAGEVASWQRLIDKMGIKPE
jgi:tripartite-type tricarboxylate transporter receptor subunit TctC